MVVACRHAPEPIPQQGDEAREQDIGNGVKLRHLRAAPLEKSDNGFDTIGFASRIFSRFYRSETSAGDQVTRIQGEPRPEWFQPLADWDFKASKLAFRLFRFMARGDDLEREGPPVERDAGIIIP